MTTKTTEPRTHVTRLSGRLSQCTGCGEVFSSISAFDKHRAWQDGRRICRDPAALGMVITSSTNGTRWGERQMTEHDKSQIKAA